LGSQFNIYSAPTIANKNDLAVLFSVAKNAEYVGDNFVSEVRSIHYDKKKKRNIYGNATFEETKELQEEGIDVATIPWAPKENA